MDCFLFVDIKVIKIVNLYVKFLSDKLLLYGNELRNFRIIEIFYIYEYFGMVGFKLYIFFMNWIIVGCILIGK